MTVFCDCAIANITAVVANDFARIVMVTRG